MIPPPVPAALLFTALCSCSTMRVSTDFDPEFDFSGFRSLSWLTVDFVDSRTNRLVWRGSAQAEVYSYSTPEQREARIDDAVGQILETFPSRRASDCRTPEALA